METFRTMQDVSLHYKEACDCSVKAIAIACGIQYKEALDALAQAGRKPRQGSFKYQQRNALLALGFKMEDLGKPTRPNGGGFTVRTIHEFLPRKGHFMIYTNGHVAAVLNQHVEDWTINRMHRITGVWRITNPRKVDERDPPEYKPKEMTLEQRTHHRVECCLIGDVNQKWTTYRSFKAALEANELSLRGHQKYRRYLKRYGTVCWQDFEFRLIEEESTEECTDPFGTVAKSKKL